MANKLRVIPWVATNAFKGINHPNTRLKEQAKFMHSLNGGVVVPWFDEIREDKPVGEYTIKDSVVEGKSITFKTDAKVSVSGSLFYSSWNMIPDERDGVGIQWGVEYNTDHSTKNVGWNNAFYVHSPGAGKDHRQSYYFGDTRKYVDLRGNQIEKTYHSYMKNVLGLYWSWKRVDKEYYSVIGKISFEYMDSQGTIYNMIPHQPSFDDGEPSSTYGYAPYGNADIRSKDVVTVNRGVGLNAEQAQFVVDQELYFKGIHIQVNRETPGKTGKGDPKGWFFNFTPWILGDTKTRFDDGYGVNIWDLYVLEYRNSTDPIVLAYAESYMSKYWTSKGRDQRRAYFDDPKNRDTGKQLVNVRNSNNNSLEYTDELLEIKPVPVRRTPESVGSLVDTYIYSNIKNEPWDNLAEGEDPEHI